MTVIMGQKTANKMYLGADNRVCTTEDKFIRDNDNKIVVVNKNVAVAFAGNAGMQLLFEKIIKNCSRRCFKMFGKCIYNF